MSEVSFGPVSCGKCGTQLNEKTGLPEDQRSPCPACGSKGRTYAVLATTRITALSSVKATGVRAGLSRGKGWFKRIFSGQVLQSARSNTVADVERTFDRDGDRYTEKITMRDTGEVIHYTDEPLSEHTGHGSDKHKN